MPRAVFRLLLLAIVVSCALDAHSDTPIPRIGILSPTTPEGTAGILEGLRQGLRERGYVEGTNIEIESRFAYDRFDRLPALARELIGLRVDVLVTYVTQASLAAKQSTSTIPIVMIGVGDPVGSGLVSSLSGPGTNVTGTSGSFVESAGKRLQLLSEAVHGLKRVAVLWNPDNTVFHAQVLDQTRAAARPLGIELQLFEVRGPESIEHAFAAMAKQGVEAVNVLPDPVLAANWPRVAALATRMRLPSVSAVSGYAEAGGLLAYGPSLPDMARNAGGYVAKILKGAKPGDLPVEQPTKFVLVINLKAAKTLGLTIPQALLMRADDVIQ
jgi:putative ABC transport system substrate-binding protein